MSREAVRGYDDLTQEEIELINDTIERRIGGIFLRSRHPKRRNKKGKYDSTSGAIYLSRNLESLITRVKRDIMRTGVLANAGITNVAIRRVVTKLFMESQIWYEAGAWRMNVSLMDNCREQSQRLSDEARQRRSAERMNRGFVPPVQRQRRRAPAMA